jgi:hypothetical protein
MIVCANVGILVKMGYTYEHPKIASTPSRAFAVKALTPGNRERCVSNNKIGIDGQQLDEYWELKIWCAAHFGMLRFGEGDPGESSRNAVRHHLGIP